MTKPEGPRIIVALDYDNAATCLALADRLDPTMCRLKVGKELFTASGPQIVATLVDRGFDIFLDLKFHDIPNTVARAVKAAADLGVWMVNVHASGGARMMSAAREALESRQGKRPLLIAVTVLTSMEVADLKQIGIEIDPDKQVLRLARLAHTAGLDGVVCSAREAPLLRQAIGTDFCLVTPGIRPMCRDARVSQCTWTCKERPAEAAQDDQRRIVTPEQALAAGSSYLVIGRPITQASDPVAACEKIARAITMSSSPTPPVPVITVDGPSGSGKGTLSQLLARRLGFHMLDSGALYRLTALAGELHGVDMEDEQQLAAQAAQLDVRFDTGAGSTRIVLEGQDVTDRIREERVSMNASRVAAYQPVRDALLARQRAFRQAPGLVADGRDMGTQVFPGAEVKIFLTASAEERARRRYKQLLEKGESVSFDAILADIQARDERDTKRAASPLKPAADAQLLDSTELSIEEVLKAIMVTVEVRLGLRMPDV